MLRRLSSFLPRLYLPLLLLLCASYAWRPLKGGYDFWAHAAVGRWMFHESQIPTRTLFLWSADVPWVAHSWASELFFYALIGGGNALRAGLGPYLVVGFTVLMVALVFGLLWRLWTRRAPARSSMPFVAPLLFALAIWCSHPRFQPRQELFSALFLVVLMAFLVAWSERRISETGQNQTLTVEGVNAAQNAAPQTASKRFFSFAGGSPSSGNSPRRAEELFDPAALALVLMFVAWVNLHALFALGLALLGISAVCDCVQDRFDRRSRALLALAVLCAAATLVNPYGLKVWEAAAPLQPGSLADSIDEWKPPYWERGLWPYVAGEVLLVVAALWAWARNPDRRWSQLLWLLLTTVMFLRARRMLWLLAIVALGVMAANAPSFEPHALWRTWRRRIRQPEGMGVPPGLETVARLGAIAILLMWLAGDTPRGIFGFKGVARAVRTGVPEGAVPEGAAALVEARRLPGRVFNDYENSSYLQWRFNGWMERGPHKGRVLRTGRRPLYIDLLNAYPVGPGALLDEYFLIMDATPQGLKSLDAHRINTVILGEHKRRSRLADWLSGAGAARWKRLYNGPDGLVWTRRAPLAPPPKPSRAARGQEPGGGGQRLASPPETARAASHS